MEKKLDDSQVTILSHGIAKLHKEYFGKGPNDIVVAINQSIIVIKAVGVLTVMEKYMLDIPEGYGRVRENRFMLFDKLKDRMLMDLSVCTGLKLKGLMVEFLIQYDGLIIVLFKPN